jgi:nucleoside-diphosphate-sugar epimerase
VHSKKNISGIKFMKCCIIGGVGFIGEHLIQALLETGREILVIGMAIMQKVDRPNAHIILLSIYYTYSPNNT